MDDEQAVPGLSLENVQQIVKIIAALQSIGWSLGTEFSQAIQPKQQNINLRKKWGLHRFPKERVCKSAFLEHDFAPFSGSRFNPANPTSDDFPSGALVSLSKGVKVLETAVGATFYPNQVLLSKNFHSRPGCRQKSLLRISGIGGGVET